MASLLNNASLLLNPAGSIISYQEDKIYSVLPKDGTGDFTFSGGDGGTRVNQQGYIEQTPANLVTYSEDFSNWTGNLFNNWINLAVTADFAVAPNGTLTADRLGDGYSRFNVSATAIPGQTYTFSIYLKNISLNASFDVYAAWGLNGTLVSYNPPIGSVAISDLSTTEWKRFTFTTTAPASGINQMQFGIAPFTGYGTNPAGTFILAWGGMVNIGSTALPYQPTTDRLNYPRITYQNGRGALLSEPQRTNLNTYSQFISSSTYSYTGLTIVYGSTTSPDGTQNASKLVEDTGTGQRYILKSSPFGSFGTYVCSFYAKPNGREWIYFEVGAVYGYANIANGELGSTGTFDAGWAFNNYGIEPWKDGWYRVWITGTWSSGGAYYAPKIHPAISNGNFSYTGNGVSGIYVYGIQVEAGSYPTSYIPTTSATVTRPADASSDTSATSVIGQTEGVIYSDLFFEPNGAERNYIYLNDSTGYNAGFCYLVGTTTNRLALDLYNNPYTQQFSALSPVLTSGRYKAAIAYKQNDFAFYLNGVQIATDNNGTVPTLDRVYIGQGSDLGFPQGGPVFTTALFNTRLTNTQLAELTTVRSGSGGNISYNGPYTIHTFTGSATFTPSFNGEVEVLVVAGGGGGGSAGDAFYEAGGGGGAGGLLYASSYGVSQGTGITVTIGAGGVGGLSYTSTSPSNRSGNGSNSVFGGLTAIGGGGGGGAYYGANSGGSGGGADGWYSNAVGVPYGNGTIEQGNRGGAGNGLISTSGAGGGGGGAGAIGSNGLGSGNLTGGAGGNGLPYSISGFSTYYAGGGGGKTAVVGSGVGGNGGLGGGGNGGVAGSVALGAAGVNYTGGGGGGGLSTSTATGAGGTGVVIVRYLT